MTAAHEQLARYQARKARILTGEGSEEISGEGGGLVEALDTLSVAPLMALFSANPGIQALELEDEGVVLRMERTGGEVRLEQLAPLALALEVTQLDGEGLARPVGHTRVVERERGGRVARHHA